MSDENEETKEVELDIYGNIVHLDANGDRVRSDVDTSKPYTVSLLHPVEVGSVTTTEITFKPVTGKIMRSLSAKKGKEVEEAFRMAQKLSGVTSLVLDGLQGPDVAEVMEVAGLFLDPTRRTGKTRTAT